MRMVLTVAICFAIQVEPLDGFLRGGVLRGAESETQSAPVADAATLHRLKSLAEPRPDVESLDWFPFPIPIFSDAAPAFDLSALNEKPAGASGWLRPSGEHFVDGKGRPVRLLGFNIAMASAFPDADAAPKIARRLAQLGVNAVRLSFLDFHYPTSAPGRSLIPPSNDLKKDGLNAESLERLDRFIAALRQEGIYVHLVLHTAREYPGYGDTLPHLHKGVDQFMPDMIDGLKQYARLLLLHENPHTGLRYCDDPAVAVLEIVNEDSLVKSHPMWLADSPERVRETLRAKFLSWLGRAYTDDEALLAAWGRDTGFTGPEMLEKLPLSAWIAEPHAGSQHSIAPLSDGKGVRWTAVKPGAVAWAILLRSSQLPLETGKRYRVSFEARSPDGLTLHLEASQGEGADYRNLGLAESCRLDSDWRAFSFEVSPSGTGSEGRRRLLFSLFNHTGTVEIRSISLRPVSTGFLKPDQTLAQGTIPLPGEGAPMPVHRDFLKFLAQVELDFVREIKTFLREELGCRQMIVGSQVMFGGILGARREALASDFADTHGYWQHPRWDEGRRWDPVRWSIGNSSQIRGGGASALADIALERVVGKPFSVSEHDLPAPSDYTTEMWPLYAAMACFQDWSAIFQHTLAHTREDYESRKMGRYFNASGHPVKLGFLPFAAAVFRMGLVEKAHSTAVLHVAEADLYGGDSGRMYNGCRHFWRNFPQAQATDRGALALSRRTGIDFSGSDKTRLELQGDGAAPWTWDAERGIFLLNAPAARVWCGEIGGQELTAGDARCRVGELPGPAPHGTVAVVALDGKPLAQSRRVLVTAARRAANPGMKWNESRTSVGDDWGSAPAGVVGLRASLTLPGSPWTVTALDPSGANRSPSKQPGGPLELSPKDATLWFLLER